MGQIIVALGRENGSGGHDIAAKIAEILNIEMFDWAVLREAVRKLNPDMDPGDFQKYEEAPRKLGASRRRAGYTNSMEEILAEMEFEFIKEKAKEGTSFVVVGRCADRLLTEHKGLIKIFITADYDKKTERIALRHNVSKAEAEKIIEKADKGRKRFYESYSGGIKWGDSFWYDITINSSRMGLDETADFLADFIRKSDRMPG